MRASMILAALVVLALPAHAATKKQIELGKSFAIEACSACHQVRPGQKPPPPVFDSNEQMDVTAPSFMEIARTHGVDVKYLRKHITEPEWPMREQMLDEYYLEDIIDYIGSLKPAEKGKR
jgi:mono/diheme cytochrome c family protein